MQIRSEENGDAPNIGRKKILRIGYSAQQSFLFVFIHVKSMPHCEKQVTADNHHDDTMEKYRKNMNILPFF